MIREMKDSGIAWIGEIPKGWKVELIGNQVKEVCCPNIDCKEDNALQFKMGSIISKSQGNSKYTPETLEGYNVVDKGVIMLNGLNLSFDFISQRIGLVKERGVITSTYIAVKPTNNIDSDFLTYLFKAYDNCKAFHSMGKGLRQTLSYGELRKYQLLYPNLKEQQKIAEYLDMKCGEIDELVVLQEKMIEELKAYKQSVITEAVTKGLNPNIPMKDSGIEWIGEIPEHWEIKELKFALEGLCDGTHGTYERVSDGKLLLSAKNIGDNGIVVGDNESQISYEDYVKIVSNGFPRKGDVLLCCVGSIGKCCLFENDEPVAFQRSVAFLRNNKTILSRYLMFLLKSNIMQAQYGMFARKSAQSGIYMGLIKDFIIVSPSLSEQQQIADYLDRKCAEIDDLVAVKQQKIESLKEYKKSLIYEYVTGKKEVI